MENALSSIFRQKMHGIQSWQRVICILTVCGWLVLSKAIGYSTNLLNACIEDSKAKGEKGICILSAAKKKPFLADPKFLKL